MTGSPMSWSQQLPNPGEDEDAEMIDQEDQENEEEAERNSPSHVAQDTRQPRETRKDKDLNTFLNSMDRYAPIVTPEANSLLTIDTGCSHRLLSFPGGI